MRNWLRLFVDAPENERDPTGFMRLFQSSRSFARTHVPLTDGVLAFAVFAVGLLSIALAHRSTSAGLLGLFTVLLALPLAWRRRAPITVFLAIAVVAFAQWLANVQVLADIALLAALYTVAAHRPRRAAVAGALLLGIGAVLAATRWGESPPATFSALSGVVVAALVSGLYVRARRSHIASLVERAAVAERARISREMHDVMAHSLAVVIALANGATAKMDRHPEQSREALESIAELGRQALTDTRRLLSVLRAEENPTGGQPQLGVEDIAGLVERAASTGIAATLTVHGDPVPISASFALSAYRIVQEAITNALKHAEEATMVAVELTWTPRRLEIEVTDDGHSHRRSGASASGFGLTGMRERAALYGGTATAGPRREGGWTVKATLPTAERSLT